MADLVRISCSTVIYVEVGKPQRKEDKGASVGQHSKRKLVGILGVGTLS